MKKPTSGAVTLTTTEILSLEMRYQGYKFITQHITKEQPITYIMMNVTSQILYNNALLSGVLKFIRVLSFARITGTRSA